MNRGPQDDAAALNVMGMRQLASSDAKGALNTFRQALSASPGNPIILNNLGNALLQLDRMEDAEDAYRSAIAASPDYPRSHANLGLLLFLEKRKQEAIGSYCRYLDLEPEDGEAWHNLGLLYMAEDDDENARAAFGQAARLLTPDTAERAANLGIGSFYLDDLDTAEEYLKTALSRDPGFVSAKYYSGLIYLRRGWPDRAIDALEEVLAVAPDYPSARSNLAMAYDSAGAFRDEHEDG